MITELATVSYVGEDYVEVTSEVKSTCSSCQQVDTCGSGQVAKAFPQKQLSLQVSTLNFTETLVMGDQVEIAIPQDQLLKSLWHVYGLPLIFLVVFAGLGQQFIVPHSHELIAIVFAVFGGYLGFKLAHKQENRQNQKLALQPYLVKKVKSTIKQHLKIDVVNQ